MTDRRGSVFVDQVPDTRAPPTPVPAPVSTGDILGAHWTLGRQDFAGAQLQSEIDGYGPIVTELLKREKPGWLGITPDPYTTGARQGMPYSTGRIWAKVAEIRQTEPGFMKDIPAKNEAEFTAYVAKQELARRQGAQDVTGRQQGLAQNTLGFTTDIATGFADPINLGAMILSGGTIAPVEGAVKTTASTMARTMLREGAINAGTEVAELPSIADNRKRFGEDMTAGEMVQDVVTAGIGGAAIPVGLHAAGSTVKATGRAIANSPIGEAAARITAPLALATTPIGRATDAEVATHFAKAVPAEFRTPDEQAALHVIDRQSDIAATNPFKPTPAGLDAHADRLDAATADILTRGDPNGGATIAQPVPRRTVTAPSIDPTAERAKFMARVGGVESGGNPNAKNPLSSATGHYQFTDATWLTYYKRIVGNGTETDAQILAQRSNPAIQERLMTSLTDDNAAHLRRMGAPETAGNLYLEHFAGQGGAERILKAEPHTPIEGLLSREAIEANPFLKGKTAGDVIEWAHAKMGERPHDGPVLARDNFSDDAAWAAAQREVEAADLASQVHRDIQDRAAPDAGLTPAEEPAIPASAEPKSFDLMPADEPVRAATPIIAPETLANIKSYISENNGSLRPEVVAKKLAISPDDARSAMTRIAATPDGGISHFGESFRRNASQTAPLDLNAFLARAGGIADSEGHALTKGRNLQKFVPGAGNLIRKSGMSLDRAREMAAEAGYFHDLSPSDAMANTTTADFLDLLDHAHGGGHFALGDLAAAEARAHAQTRSAEHATARGAIDARLTEHGFDLKPAEIARAADAVLHDGLTHDGAILRVVNEHIQDVLDAAAREGENARYVELANDFEAVLAETDRWAATDIHGQEAVPGNASGGDAFASEHGSANGNVWQDRALADAKPKEDATADSLYHDLRAELTHADPAIAVRQAQEAALKAGSPLRSLAEQESTIGSPLFDAVDQPTFRLNDEGEARTLGEILDSIDEEASAIAAVKACL